MRGGKNEQHSSNFPPIAAQKQHLWQQIDYWNAFFIYFPQLDTHINRKQKVWMWNGGSKIPKLTILFKISVFV